MGFFDRLKDLGSKVIKTIIKPRVDFKKLNIDPSKFKPLGPRPKPFNPTKPIDGGVKQLLKPAVLPVLKKQDLPAAPVKHGRGLIAPSKEQIAQFKEAMRKGHFK